MLTSFCNLTNNYNFDLWLSIFSIIREVSFGHFSDTCVQLLSLMRWGCPSVRLFVCPSPKCKNAIFSKTKQFRAMVSIDDL